MLTRQCSISCLILNILTFNGQWGTEESKYRHLSSGTQPFEYIRPTARGLRGKSAFLRSNLYLQIWTSPIFQIPSAIPYDTALQTQLETIGLGLESGWSSVGVEPIAYITKEKRFSHGIGEHGRHPRISTCLQVSQCCQQFANLLQDAIFQNAQTPRDTFTGLFSTIFLVHFFLMWTSTVMRLGNSTNSASYSLPTHHARSFQQLCGETWSRLR